MQRQRVALVDRAEQARILVVLVVVGLGEMVEQLFLSIIVERVLLLM